ncbi:MAG: ABC transporter ATP-binding/permease protein [Verrucomicrobia subdivision 3 bacterium]|nr:ABC transporter ATP-binding/permease protein [Limisphaerales bacterium]MCS1414132.1 ABC transporter ATP-binding/permease protein [Limisphaerales bacterium]
MIELHYLTWDGNAHSKVLPLGRSSLGRTADNDIAINELSISAHHCEFEVVADKVIVRDLDSASGTFLDGQLVSEAVVVPGQTLNLGTFAIRIAAPADESPRKRSSGSLTSRPPRQLGDGTYSCMCHEAVRAAFECDRCFNLFCLECFDGENHDASDRRCPLCGDELRGLDWSGMERTTKDVVRDLLPAEVKKVLRYWQQVKNWRSEKDE